MQNLKLTFTTYLGLIFFIGMFVAIFMVESVSQFALDITGESSIQDSKQAVSETANILLSLDKITFDTTVLNSPYIQGLIPMPDFPVDAQTVSNFGKANPFIGSFSVTSDSASSSVGAVVYSNQRGANEGNSIRAVSPNRR